MLITKYDLLMNQIINLVLNLTYDKLSKYAITNEEIYNLSYNELDQILQIEDFNILDLAYIRKIWNENPHSQTHKVR